MYRRYNSPSGKTLTVPAKRLMSENLRISLIVAFYKDLEALDLIIRSLKKQSYSNFELVVAEDNNAQETRDYLESVHGLDILHTSQADNGIQKARSVNNAILASTGDYLVFIDGDCVPHRHFLRAHAELAHEGTILTGRRVNLGPTVSRMLRKHSLRATTLQYLYPLATPLLALDKATHVAQGLFFEPRNWIYSRIIAKRKKTNLSLLGCNYSCYKADMMEIGGYDECYGETALADDTDLQWRFRLLGLQTRSCKMAAIVYHLYHPSYRTIDASKQIAFMEQRKLAGDYHAHTGLESHVT